MSLTFQQAKLLSFVQSFIDANKYPPSHRQIATHLGYRAVRSVQQLLEQLERKGYVTHTPRIGHSLRIVGCFAHKNQETNDTEWIPK